MELSILCDTKVAVVVIDGNQEAAVYSSVNFDDVVQTVTIKRPPRFLSNIDVRSLPIAPTLPNFTL
jgi:hypothetical protein